MNKIHELIHRLHNPDLGILFIRIAAGVVFVHAGWWKVTNMQMTIGFFAQMGFVAPLAYFVSYAEFIGGLLFMLGIFARYAGIVLTAIMLVAVKVLFSHGFGLQNGGYEYALVLMLASAAIVALGSGKYSLADILKR